MSTPLTDMSGWRYYVVQLPEFKKYNIDAKLLEVIMMHARPRIMMNAEHTKLKAIQGHTLDTLDFNQLYEKIISIAHYYNHPLWQGGVAPDTLVVEISHENYWTIGRGWEPSPRALVRYFIP